VYQHSTPIVSRIGLAIGVVTIAVSHASADDTLKLAIPMRGNWENVAPDLGERAGIFKKHGLALEKVYTQGAGETLQVVVPGSADIGLGVGTSAVIIPPWPWHLPEPVVLAS
jgi:NitT/TauT family transport system substrate-binding protein